MTRLGWCDSCNVPILDGLTCGICSRESRLLAFAKTELKPIFEEERLLYNNILQNFCDYVIPSGTAFYNVMGEVIIDGRKVFRLSFDKNSHHLVPKFFKSFQSDTKLIGSDLKKTIKANKRILKSKETEAVQFLKQTMEQFSSLPLAVSFSGGKDSTVTLALVKLIDPKFDVIFLNTTVEFEQTVEYVHLISKLWNLNLIETHPSHDFFDLCLELGPPSTRMKWCCKTQKFSPQNQLINEKYKDGLLAISGIRKNESNIRSAFNRVQKNRMIPKQTLAFPILSWSSLDVWLYLLWKKVPYNKMYDFGFSRVGCWACPEKSLRDLHLVEKACPTLSKKLENMLKNYAEACKLDAPDFWIKNGDWRTRRTKWVRIPACTTSKPCSLANEVILTFDGNAHLETVKEFMKVFGAVKQSASMFRVANKQIEITVIGSKMRVNIITPEILPIFQKQLSRALNCVGCGACSGVCDYNALTVINGKVRISSEKCVGCLKCVTANGIRMSCVSVNYRPQLSVVA